MFGWRDLCFVVARRVRGVRRVRESCDGREKRQREIGWEREWRVGGVALAGAGGCWRVLAAWNLWQPGMMAVLD